MEDVVRRTGDEIRVRVEALLANLHTGYRAWPSRKPLGTGSSLHPPRRTRSKRRVVNSTFSFRLEARVFSAPHRDSFIKYARRCPDQ